MRKEEEYFEDIPDEKFQKDMLELASHIVETKSGHFAPEEFEDQYEDALKELLKKKQAGEKIGHLKSVRQQKSSIDGCAAPKRGSGARRVNETTSLTRQGTGQ